MDGRWGSIDLGDEKGVWRDRRTGRRQGRDEQEVPVRDWPKQRTCIGVLRAGPTCVDSIITMTELKDASKKIVIWILGLFAQSFHKDFNNGKATHSISRAGTWYGVRWDTYTFKHGLSVGLHDARGP